MDNKEFLSKEQCETLSELNYDGDYDFAYHATGELWERGKKDKKERFLPAPLKQQVLRWFREKYEVYPTIMTETVDDNIYFRFIAEGAPEWLSFSKIYYTYEEAEDGAINKLIKLAKQQDNEN